MSTRTRWGLFAGLLLVWAALLGYRILMAPDPIHVPLKYAAGQPAKRSDLGDGPRTPATARRTAQTVTWQEPKNIFAALDHTPDKKEPAMTVSRPRRSPVLPPPIVVEEPKVPEGPPPPTPEELAEQEARRQQALAAEALRRQEALVMDEARQRLGQYRFLGYVMQQGEQRAFLAKGKDLYIVKVGEIVDGKVHVTRMDSASVKLTDAATKLEQTVALSKESAGSL
jgi:hypothetical protein